MPRQSTTTMPPPWPRSTRKTRLMWRTQDRFAVGSHSETLGRRVPENAFQQTLYKMVLIFLSIIVAAIVVAISMIHSSFGILANSGTVREETPKAREEAEQSRVAGQTTQFLVVLLPDGRVANPTVADRF